MPGLAWCQCAEVLVQTSPVGRPAGNSPLAAGCRGYILEQGVAAIWIVLCAYATAALKSGCLIYRDIMLQYADMQACLNAKADMSI